MRSTLLQRLREIDIICVGDFLLRNGAHSSLYLDVKKAYGSPDILNLIADELYHSIDKKATCIAASGYGGIIPASIISERYKIPLAALRAELKDHGRRAQIEGYVPQQHDFISIVDDVFSTGSNLRQAINILQPTGAHVLGCHVIVKRGEGDLSVPWTYLFTQEELMDKSPAI